jgi:GNAT superfamily N-acetyltransferase
VLLADGRIASIRPLVGEDEAALIALHDEVGDDNLRLRFFSQNRESAHRYVEHLVHGTGDTVATLVATVRDSIVAVATAERAGPDSAEVALLVADVEHGHGLGSLLLEHLAAACRDNGVRLFVAEVLSENAAMIRVFRDVGFETSRRSRSGVVSVEMSTEASSNAIAAADLRESVSEARSLAPLLYP